MPDACYGNVLYNNLIIKFAVVTVGIISQCSKQIKLSVTGFFMSSFLPSLLCVLSAKLKQDWQFSKCWQRWNYSTFSRSTLRKTIFYVEKTVKIKKCFECVDRTKTESLNNKGLVK